MALVAAAPVGALAAGEESGGGSTVGETGTESSSGSTESTPPAASEGASPAASTGWVPQGEGAEATSHEAGSTRRGSSLGSGAVPKQPGSASEQPGSASGESSYSGGYYEQESPAPSTSEEPVSKPQAGSPVGSVAPQAVGATPDKGGHAAVGVATPVALPDPPQAAGKSPASPAAALAVSTHDRVASGSGSLPLPILIVGLLILVYSGARLLLGPVEPDLFRSGPLQRVRRALSRV